MLWSASEYSHTAFEEEFKTFSTANNEIPGVALIKSVCTSYASALVIEQVKLCTKIKYSVTAEDSTHINVAYKDHLHGVNIDDHQITCSRSFWKTMGLPCRHIFAAQKIRIWIFLKNK